MNLEQTVRYISAEGHGATSPFASNPLREVVRDFISNIRGFVNTSNDKLSSTRVSLFMPDKKLEKEITTRNYTDIRNVTVFIPVGMSSTWLEYLSHLEPGIEIAGLVKQEVLEPLKVYLAFLLSEPERLSNALESMQAKKVKLHKDEIAAVKAGIAQCFSSKSEEPMVPYGKVFLRNAEWADTCSKIRTLSDKMAKINTADLVDASDELGKSLDKLYMRMKTEPEVFVMSNITATEISELIFHSAKELEFVAAISTMLQVAEVAIDDTMKKLKGAFME